MTQLASAQTKLPLLQRDSLLTMETLHRSERAMESDETHPKLLKLSLSMIQVVSIFGIGNFAQEIICRKFIPFDPVDSPAYAKAQRIELRTVRNERAEEQSLCPVISARQGLTRLTSLPFSTWAVAFRVLINKGTLRSGSSLHEQSKE
ncbi:unnamed protein product [Leuciscus chuanchicus]